MRQVIAALFSAKEEAGARLGAYGFFIAIVGGILAFTGSHAVGYWIVLIGALIAIGGIAMHFIVNWRMIFRIDQ